MRKSKRPKPKSYSQAELAHPSIKWFGRGPKKVPVLMKHTSDQQQMYETIKELAQDITYDDSERGLWKEVKDAIIGGEKRENHTN